MVLILCVYGKIERTGIEFFLPYIIFNYE